MVNMEFRDSVYLTITGIGNLLAIYFGLYVAPAEVEMGELVRILYFHLPGAIVTYITLTLSMVSSILYLRKREWKYDVLAESSAFLGLVYGLITIVVGSIWANATWGVYWNWDPRETTTLILWFAYLGYFLLRMSVENLERRASVSAVFSILSFLTVPLSYASFIIWPSLHPRIASSGGIGLTGTMVQALVLNMLTGLLFYFWLLRKTYQVRTKSNELLLLTLKEGRHAG